MNELIKDKLELDDKILSLIHDFSDKYKCGYKASVSSVLVKECLDNEEFVVCISKSIDSVITT